jgi:hypothetical protein
MMMYCQQCDSIVEELTATGTCACGNAVVDLTAIVEAADQRMIAQVREWAIAHRNVCVAKRNNTGDDVELWCRYRGAELAMNALIAYLNDELKAEAQL